MLNDLAWRKVPRNIIRDENIEYISSLLPENLKAAPMLLYFIMYCKADDEGVVDLEDGAIYSRLMMNTATPEAVIEIARLMAKRKLLLPVVADVNVYIIEDWDIPARPGVRASRTMEERRAAVAAKIRQEQAQKQDAIDFDRLRAGANAFFCAHDDKIRVFVDTERDKREIRENSETRDLKEIEREKTHTESSNGAFSAPYAAQEKLQENFRQTDIQNPAELEKETQFELTNPVVSAPESLKPERVQNFEEQRTDANRDIQEVYVVFKEFFAKNCLGFQEAKYKNELMDLAECICLLKDEINTPPVIAVMFCKQFKLLSEGEGYYHNLPLFPSELLKPAVYRTVLSMTSKVLCNKSVAHGWIEQSKALNEIPGRAVYDDLQKMLLESNINPDSEHPLRDYLIKKATVIK